MGLRWDSDRNSLFSNQTFRDRPCQPKHDAFACPCLLSSQLIGKAFKQTLQHSPSARLLSHSHDSSRTCWKFVGSPQWKNHVERLWVDTLQILYLPSLLEFLAGGRALIQKKGVTKRRRCQLGTSRRDWYSVDAIGRSKFSMERYVLNFNVFCAKNTATRTKQNTEKKTQKFQMRVNECL